MIASGECRVKKERVISAMKLPMDVFLGELVVSLIGRRAVYVENYRSILFYTDTRLKLQGKDYYTGDNMKVTGLIESVELEA